MTEATAASPLSVTWPSPRVAVLTLKRPDAANTMNIALATELCDTVESLGVSDAPKVLVVSGAGRFFSAGGDLHEAGKPPDWLATCRRAIECVADFPTPVIAAINGPALGGGLELALACDLRVADRSAPLGLPEIRFGELPAAGGMKRLLNAVGSSRAAHLIMTGRSITALEACELGIVNEAVGDGGALERSIEIAEDVAQYAAYALRTAKAVLSGGAGLSVREALPVEYQAVDTMATAEERTTERRRAAERDPSYAKLFKSLEAATRRHGDER